MVQVALPAVPPEALLALGEALRPLRDEGILLVASGGLVHNLGDLDFARPDAPPAAWAVEFDRWAWERAALQEREPLALWQRLAPHPARAHPQLGPLRPAAGGAGRCLAPGAGRAHPRGLRLRHLEPPHLRVPPGLVLTGSASLRPAVHAPPVQEPQSTQ